MSGLLPLFSTWKRELPPATRPTPRYRFAVRDGPGLRSRPSPVPDNVRICHQPVQEYLPELT